MVELGQCLKNLGYEFTTITPTTHARVIARPSSPAVDEASALRDLFGWSKAVAASSVPREVVRLLEISGQSSRDGNLIKSAVRFSSVDEMLFMHSAFPTVQADTVFFGPDSYRFVRFLKQTITQAKTIVDLGAGSGVGGLCLAKHLGSPDTHVILSDINARALQFVEINARINGFKNVSVIRSDLLDSVPSGADTVIANPPFIIDESGRTYRHGGSHFGMELSVRIVDAAMKYLGPDGQLALYTAACSIDGEDHLWKLISPRFGKRQVEYSEIDPDIFGEQLDLPTYARIERLAAVGCYVRNAP